MTIKRYAGDKLVGLSSDTKPTNIPDGATFYETDTLSSFLLVNGVWEDTSITGAQGIQGITGAQGTTGSQGIQGITGEQGLQGTIGAQGIQGTTGSQGTQGLQGMQGITGAQGLQGITGAQGTTGSQGITGAQGTTGTQGTQGRQGITGAQGTQGRQGIIGAQGTTGTQGTQGRQGITGAQGTTGTQGIQGRQGITGAQGTTGTQGIQGRQGTTGPSTTINATNDTSATALYPVMVGAAGSNQTAKVTTTKFSFNASTGTISAVSKSFIIDHPTKEGMKLRHGSLEGPENGVYVRGRLKDSYTIELPDYWTGLVDEETITVTLTPIGKYQQLFVEDIADNKVVVGNDSMTSEDINCFYVVWAERKDVAPFDVEYED